MGRKTKKVDGKDTLEANKLIAKFMDAKRSGSATTFEEGGITTIANQYSVKITDLIEVVFYDKPSSWTDVHPMQFHTSWDWLMPVIAKIEATNRVHDNEYYPYLFTIWKNCSSVSDGNNGNIIVQEFLTDKLSAAYWCTVRFIEWYYKNRGQLK